MRTYDERLTPPVALWVAVWVGSLALGLSFYAALGPAAGLLAMLVPGRAAVGGPGPVRGARCGWSDGDLVAGRPASRCARSARCEVARRRRRPARSAARRPTRPPTT